MRFGTALLLTSLCLVGPALGGACSLNPQPLPPGDKPDGAVTAGGSSGGGSSSSSGGMASSGSSSGSSGSGGGSGSSSGNTGLTDSGIDGQVPAVDAGPDGESDGPATDAPLETATD